MQRGNITFSENLLIPPQPFQDFIFKQPELSSFADFNLEALGVSSGSTNREIEAKIPKTTSKIVRKLDKAISGSIKQTLGKYGLSNQNQFNKKQKILSLSFTNHLVSEDYMMIRTWSVCIACT